MIFGNAPSAFALNGLYARESPCSANRKEMLAMTRIEAGMQAMPKAEGPEFRNWLARRRQMACRQSTETSLKRCRELIPLLAERHG